MLTHYSYYGMYVFTLRGWFYYPNHRNPEEGDIVYFSRNIQQAGAGHAYPHRTHVRSVRDHAVFGNIARLGHQDILLSEVSRCYGCRLRLFGRLLDDPPEEGNRNVQPVIAVHVAIYVQHNGLGEFDATARNAMLYMDSRFTELRGPMAPYFAGLDPLGNDLVIDSEGANRNFGAIPVIEDEDENVPTPGPFAP